MFLQELSQGPCPVTRTVPCHKDNDLDKILTRKFLSTTRAEPVVTYAREM